MGDAPVSDDFLADVAEEAAYQREHWGEAQDADKDDSFWFWTLGHIVGKAIHDDAQTVEKQRHRLRAGAALLLNWDRHTAARNGLRHDDLMLMERGPNLGPAVTVDGHIDGHYEGWPVDSTDPNPGREPADPTRIGRPEAGS